jgi:3-oxoisoapionate decarboxylase
VSVTRLGLGSYGVAWSIGVPGYPPPSAPLDAHGLIALADSLGLKVVQIADNIPLHTFDDVALARLRDDADARGIRIEVGVRGIQPDHLARCIGLAAYFRSPILRVVVDSAGHHPSPDEVVEVVRAALPLLDARGIVLAIENHDRFKARMLADMVEKLDSPRVGICLDTVNSFGALEGPAAVLDALAPHVVNLHVKEFVVRRAPHNMGFTISGAPAGSGMLDLFWLLDRLRGRAFNAIIETWLDPLDTPDATAAREQEWVRASVAYLRTLIPD